jgi:glycosyltransferase involved in cell wall biosynthesis
LDKKVSVIIPARDEESSIRNLISRIKENLAAYDYEIIVVDDGSKDNTKEIARSSTVMTLSHDRSLGKGAAMKTGARAATRDILVFLDGDGAHYPEDIPNVIAPILQNGGDLVVGSRSFHGLQASGSYWPRRIANKLASFVTSVIISFFLPLATFFKCPVKWINVADAESGFKAISKENWHRLDLISQGFEIETEMIYEAARNRLAIVEVPISYNLESRISRLSMFRDSWKTVKLLVGKLIGELKGRRAAT